MSSDGHLFVSARGGVRYAAESGHAWYDPAHKSVLVHSTSVRTLRQIALGATNAAATDWSEQDLSAGELLFDFAATTKKNLQRHQSLGDANDPPRALPPLLLARLSLDAQFVALQTSDVQVQVVDRNSGESYWILCKSKAGNRILHDGIVWNTHASAPHSSQDLFLVTKMGIEQYRVSAKRRQCTLHRTIGVYIHSFWYAASHGVLIISSGSRANEIVPYLLHGTNVERLPRLVFSTAVNPKDLYLASLYGQLYAVYGDMRANKLLLYLIGRKKVSCVRSLHLLLPPGTALEYSVVDHLLVCHSLEFNVSLFFDVKCEGSVNDPFSHPLPISLQPPKGEPPEMTVVHPAEEFIGSFSASAALRPTAVRRAHSVDELLDRTERSQTEEATKTDQQPKEQSPDKQKNARLFRAMTALNLGQMDHHQVEIDGHYCSRWRFLYPNLVVRSFTVKGRSDMLEQIDMRTLQVNIREIARSCGRHPQVLPFLLRRGDQETAKVLVLSLVRERMLEQDVSLPAVIGLLASVQTISSSELDDFSEESSTNDTSSEDETSSTPSQLLPRSSSGYFGTLLFSDSKGKRPARSHGRNANGLTLIVQSEFNRHVWQKLIPDTSIAKDGTVSMYISEFIRNLQHDLVPVEPITYLALAQSFVAAGQSHVLAQYLSFDASTESLELAGFLVSQGKEHTALMQLGLDMYFRLGAITPLVLTLLDVEEAERAIAISWRNFKHNSFDATSIPAVRFFESLVRSLSSCNSPTHAAQKLRTLWLFLKAWDSSCLEVQDRSLQSPLASSAPIPFPDQVLSGSTRDSLRAAFGFPV